jgi:hypothetical protein
MHEVTVVLGTHTQQVRRRPCMHGSTEPRVRQPAIWSASGWLRASIAISGEGMTVAADWPAIRRELRDDAAVTMGEPSGRLHDTCTARLATARTPGSCS